MKYLIATDLDGTLLHDDKTISKSTENYLKKLQEQGNLITLISGRSYSQMKKYVEQLNVNNYIICKDGMEIRDCYGKIILSGSCMSYDDISDVIAKTDCMFSIVQLITEENDIVVGNGKIFSIAYLFYLLKRLRNKKCIFVKKNHLNNCKDVYKILIKLFNKKDMCNLKTNLKDYNVFYMEEDNKIQISLKDINKKNALEFVRNLNDISKENVIVFGNDGNDIEMLKEYENSFAVFNALHDVKIIAKEIIDSNNDDGVENKLRTIIGDVNEKRL